MGAREADQPKSGSDHSRGRVYSSHRFCDFSGYFTVVLGMKQYKEEVRRHYDLLIDEGNDPVDDSEELRRYMDGWDGQIFMEELNPNSNADILEIGVGSGRLAVRVAQQCRAFTGIDLSPKTIVRARENLKNFSNVTLICADFLEYAFIEKFDLVYSSLTFLHIYEKEKAVRKIAAILKDKGRLVLSLDKGRKEILDFGSRCLRVYPDSPAEIGEYAAKAGLELLKQVETERAYIVSFKK